MKKIPRAYHTRRHNLASWLFRFWSRLVICCPLGWNSFRINNMSILLHCEQTWDPFRKQLSHGHMLENEADTLLWYLYHQQLPFTVCQNDVAHSFDGFWYHPLYLATGTFGIIGVCTSALQVSIYYIFFPIKKQWIINQHRKLLWIQCFKSHKISVTKACIYMKNRHFASII